MESQKAATGTQSYHGESCIWQLTATPEIIGVPVLQRDGPEAFPGPSDPEKSGHHRQTALTTPALSR
jgi:hypothetical protein